ECAPGEFIIGPDRFPFGKEFAAFTAQFRPLRVIGDARIAQIDGFAANDRLLAAGKSQPAHERHRPRVHHRTHLAGAGAFHYSAASGARAKRAAKTSWRSSFLTGPSAAMDGEAITRAA